MHLPADLLLANSEHLQGHKSGDQAAAWTARIGLHRSHDLASAKRGSAFVAGPSNVRLAEARSDREQLGESIVSARLRPIVAATSAAFGAILLNLRRRRKHDPKHELMEKMSSRE